MKIAVRIFLALLVLLLLFWFGVPLYWRRSVAQYDGKVAANVAAPVEITFDAKGVPQIWARTDGDAYFAIGFLHASERLFQMELVRRLSRGELAEVFGEAAYDTDVHQRTIGFARRVNAATLTPEARFAVQRYVDGVNAWIARAKMLPPEFVILRLQPRAWTVEDCLAIGFYQTWFIHELMDQDGRYQKLMEKIGMPASALMNAGHPWSPSTVPDLRITNGSNSWVVSASRSSTRAALHASDPHLSVDQAPGLWYLAGLHSDEGLNIVGVTFAGAPFVVMGHNGAIAFSSTVASVDVVDYYDDAATGPSVREWIRVKGEIHPRRLEVQNGARGPMIDKSTSMHWAGFDFDPAEITNSALRLQKATTFDEFRRVTTRFGALDVNWMYSDRQGNIGYQLGAPVPIRDYDSYLRQSARDPQTRWRGYRALDETPHALNPAQGFLATCNNQIVSAAFPYRIPGFYDPYRITRANALLETQRTPQQMHEMQRDLVSGIALRWKSLAAAGGNDDERAMLTKWDGRMSGDSREAALFNAWWYAMPRAIFEDELGAEWKTGAALLDEALTTKSPVLDDRRTPQVESAIDLSKRAMADARAIANGRTWGEACELVVAHPLARVKVLDWWLGLNRGPLPGWGDPGTLDANFYSFDEKTKSFRVRVAPSMRFVLDWSDVDAFTINGALGQSGNPLSPHYDDFLGPMQRGETWNVPFTKDKVYARSTSVLELTR